VRMSDEEYFRSCVAQERHLAQLLGMRNIEEFSESAGVLWHEALPVPRWTRNWEACGPLIAEYALHIEWNNDDADPHGPAVQIEQLRVHLKDHPTPDHALRYAVVKAVIARLEHHHDRRTARCR
jgi:hypothetical protein